MSLLAVIAICFSVGYVSLVIYFLVGWLRASDTATAHRRSQPMVSVLVSVRNEEEHIRACIDAILAQDYPAHLYEVIVIDDYSTDATLRTARSYTYENLRVLDLSKYFGDGAEKTPNKKKALTIGVKNARGTLIATTDGDCVMDSTWLTTMVDYYLRHEYKLITGPVLLTPIRRLLGLWQQADVMSLIGITAGTIASRYPVMCNGSNMLYERKVFIAVDGYKGNTDVPSGDDIYLMQKIDAAYPSGVGFVRDMRACVHTVPVATIRGLIAQRVRWTSKSTGYTRRSITAILVYVYLFNLLIMLCGLMAFRPVGDAWLPVAIAFGSKWLVDLFFNIPVYGFFKRRWVLLLLPIFECIHILYVVGIGVLGLTGKYVWKDRKIGVR
jgi:glycosyltransferase involved in cell wall biosynthesis